MGYADCKYFAGVVETSKVISNVKPGPLSDTLQGGARIFQPFQTHVAFLQFLPTGNMGCALPIVFQVRSLYVPTKNRSPSRGHFWESLVI